MAPAGPFRLDIFRLGFYQGLGARKVLSLGPFEGRSQSEPKIGPMGLASCDWPSFHGLTIPQDWLSGVYLGKLVRLPEGPESYLIFIVRDRRKADFNFQCSTNTWAAYNRWPEKNSAYDKDGNFWYWGPGTAVGWERPFGFPGSEVPLPPQSLGSGEFLLWEFPLAYWMEGQGYDLTYSSNLDTHLDAEGLLRTRAFLSVGHDEYWSRPMLANLKAAQGRGLHASFLSGNALYGIVEYGPGFQDFTRTGIFGPKEDATMAVWPALAEFRQWGPDSSELMGVRSAAPIVGLGPWTCAKPVHWLFEGTGMKEGDAIPGLVGWEFHAKPWPHPGLEVVAEGPVAEGDGRGQFQSVVFQAAGGGTVFNASTIWWAQALASPPGHALPAVYNGTPTGLQGPDERVQKMTRNLFRKFLA
jgi:hypothetical protein